MLKQWYTQLTQSPNLLKTELIPRAGVAALQPKNSITVETPNGNLVVEIRVNVNVTQDQSVGSNVRTLERLDEYEQCFKRFLLNNQGMDEVIFQLRRGFRL